MCNIAADWSSGSNQSYQVKMLYQSRLTCYKYALILWNNNNDMYISRSLLEWIWLIRYYIPVYEKENVLECLNIFFKSSLQGLIKLVQGGQIQTQIAYMYTDL